MRKLRVSLIALTCFSSNSIAQDIDVSLGSGWPFFLVPTVSTKYDDVELYVNYKLGLDDGFTLGAQKQYENHVVGIFLGAVGARDAEYSCEDELTCPIIRLALTDAQTTQGIGMSYEYRLNTSREGWAFRVEAGYGKESQNDTNRFDGNAQVVYHF